MPQLKAENSTLPTDDELSSWIGETFSLPALESQTVPFRRTDTNIAVLSIEEDGSSRSLPKRR